MASYFLPFALESWTIMNEPNKGGTMKFESQHRNINKAFDDNIDAALANIYGAVDDDHAKMAVDDLKVLVEAKKDFNADRNAMIQKVVGVGGTLVCVGLMLAFETNNVLTTKALSFIPKPKI